MPYVDELRESVCCLGPWAELPFFSGQPSPFDRVCQKLEGITDVQPAPEGTFDALRSCPPDEVRVVVLGQDPYPTPEHATGLAFSVPRETCPLPPTLWNISEEMRCDLGFNLNHGDLTSWAEQGILLLNSVLTKTEPAVYGWNCLINDVFSLLQQQDHAENIFWVFWGGESRRLIPPRLDEQQMLETSHPNPRNRNPRLPFSGSKPFSKINSFLRRRNPPAINWQVPT